MKLTKGEIVDKYTILLVKKMKGLPVKIDFTVDENIDYTELYKINLKMFEIEDLITKEKSLLKIGAFYLALRGLTIKRNEEKNKINLKYGEEIEIKNY